MLLESPRLMLVPLQFPDAAPLLQAVRESLAELAPWEPWATPEYTLRTAQDYIAFTTQAHLHKTDFDFAIKRKDGHLIGIIGLHPRPDHMNRPIPAFEIGYWVRTGAARNGFATEAVQRLTQYALDEEKARRVAIHCHSGNLPSARVAQKVGYQLEARLKNTRKNPDETLADTLVFTRLA